MLGFACIQDCSVCPFACRRDVSKDVYRQIETATKSVLPKTLKTEAEETHEDEKIEENFPSLTETENENLPTIQFEVTKSKKAGFLDKIFRREEKWNSTQMN